MHETLATRFVLAMLSVLVAAASTAAPAGVRAATNCPSSSLCNTTTTDPSGWCSTFQGGSAYFDLTQGRYHASGSNVSTQYNGTGFVGAWDRYRIAGVPAGTPLIFRAEIQVNGVASGGCLPSNQGMGAHIQATVGNPATAETATADAAAALVGCSVVCCWNSGSLDQTLSVPFSVAAGDDFLAYVVLTASASNTSADVAAQLRFTGLPAGATVTSCQGFRQDVATSAARSSWGALKLLYR